MTMPSRSTPSAPRPCATSSIFRSASLRRRPSSRSSRTTARRSRSSTPPTRSSPRRVNDSPRTSSRRDARPAWCELLGGLRDGAVDWEGQLGLVRRWYQPHLERLHDHAQVRGQDLEQLEQIGAHYPSRERFLSELTLDPPQATGDHAGPPLLDEDYLILSTIHSAKGQEWDSVFVLHASDGCIPSDMTTATPEQIEEERRL